MSDGFKGLNVRMQHNLELYGHNRTLNPKPYSYFWEAMPQCSPPKNSQLEPLVLVIGLHAHRLQKAQCVLLREIVPEATVVSLMLQLQRIWNSNPTTPNLSLIPRTKMYSCNQNALSSLLYEQFLESLTGIGPKAPLTPAPISIYEAS